MFLNRAYFSDSVLAQIIEKLRERLKPNGLLIVCRTDSVGVNHATVFESTADSKSRVLLRLGGGSEIEGLMTPETASGLFRAYLVEVLAMTRSDQAYEVLAHLDYPRRYWPHGEVELAEADFEEEYRAILKEAGGLHCSTGQIWREPGPFSTDHL